MKKDIEFPSVKGVHIAIARKKTELNQYEWSVFLINHNNFDLDNVLITSRGYGTVEGEKQQTSTLRHMFEKIAAKSYTEVERIDPAVFHLCSEYWLSYYVDKKIYDKKFIFLPDTIVEKNLSKISILDMEGILHS